MTKKESEQDGGVDQETANVVFRILSGSFGIL